MRPFSTIGWTMCQWLAVLVLGHQVAQRPELLDMPATGGFRRYEPEPTTGVARITNLSEGARRLDQSMLVAAATTGFHVHAIDHATGTIRVSG